MKKLVSILLFFLATLSSLLPSLALAAPATYQLLAPIGSLTGAVTLKEYIQGVFITAIGLAGIIAVIMIVICGIKLMGSGSVAGKSEAKQCIWNAIFGILIAVGSWLLLNTINPLLLKNDTELTVTTSTTVAPGGADPAKAQPLPKENGCFFEWKEISSGNTSYAKSGTLEMCEALRNDYQGGGLATVLTNCFCNKPNSPGVVSPVSAPDRKSVV